MKANDIELEYKDEHSIIQEDAKKRILEILAEMKKLPTVSAYEAFGVPNSGTSDSLRCTYCGANQLVTPNVMCSGNCEKAMLSTQLHSSQTK